MPARFSLLLCVLIATAASSRSFAAVQEDAASPSPQPPAAPAPAGLETILETVRARHDLPALAAAVIDGGRLAGIGAVGVRKAGDATKVTRDDRFHLGSDTKAMTATLIALLIEQGKLRWDSTVGEVLPELAKEAAAGWADVRIDQLLRHRGGAPEESAPPGVSLGAMKGWKGSPRERRTRYVAAILARPPREPGSRTAYSNAGYVIAGAMAEAVADAAWEELMRERLFAPLGMTRSGFGAPGEADAVTEPWPHLRTKSGLVPVPPGKEADNPDVLGPAGTVHASLADWARFVAAHVDGGKGENPLLTPASFAKLHEPMPEGSPFACGWMAVDRPWAKGRALTHAGSNTLNYAVVWAAPKRGLAVMICTNVAGKKAEAACDEVAGTLIGLWGLPAEERAERLGAR